MEKFDDNVQDKLIAAIIKGQLKTVETIINDLELLPDSPWLNGYRYLSIATEHRQDEIVEFLLKKNTPVNSSAERFINSPLHSAVKLNKIYMVKTLLKRGAEVDKKNLYQRNSFDIALEHGHLEILELLVDHISGTNISDESYMKLLADLLRSSHYKLMEKLLKKCLHVDISNAMPAVNFLCIAVQKNYYSVVEGLLNRGIDINSINYSRYGSQTALYIACRIGDAKIAKLLLENGASMDITYDFYYSNAPKNVDQYNLYPIHIAIVYGYYDVVEALLYHGDNCNKMYVTPYKTEYSALYLACEYQREEIVKLLVRRGADVNFRDHRGFKPIFVALSARKYDFILEKNNIFEYLIGNEKLELDFVNIKVILTNTAQRLQVDIFELVMRYGNQMDPLVRYEVYTNLMKDRSSNSLPHVAIQFNKSSMNSQSFEKYVSALITYGFDINCRDQSGKTLLHKAFWYRQEEAVELLLGYGSDYVMCDEGNTPLDHILPKKFHKTVHEDDFDEDLENFIDYITQYFVKMKLLNLYVNECDYQKLVTRIGDPYKYQVEYEKEIQVMKNYVISDGVTFFELVTADLNKMVVLLENEVIFETLNSEGYRFKFTWYKNVIKGCFYKGLVRKNLLYEVNKFTIFNVIKKLPYPCMRRIIDCFSNSDLRDIITEYSLIANN